MRVQIASLASPGAPGTTSKPMTTTEQIAELFTTFIEEDTKFTEKGNKAAGTRARKALLELGKLTKVRRGEISEAKAEG